MATSPANVGCRSCAAANFRRTEFAKEPLSSEKTAFLAFSMRSRSLRRHTFRTARRTAVSNYLSCPFRIRNQAAGSRLSSGFMATGSTRSCPSIWARSAAVYALNTRRSMAGRPATPGEKRSPATISGTEDYLSAWTVVCDFDDGTRNSERARTRRACIRWMRTATGAQANAVLSITDQEEVAAWPSRCWGCLPPPARRCSSAHSPHARSRPRESPRGGAAVAAVCHRPAVD